MTDEPKKKTTKKRKTAKRRRTSPAKRKAQEPELVYALGSWKSILTVITSIAGLVTIAISVLSLYFAKTTDVAELESKHNEDIKTMSTSVITEAHERTLDKKDLEHEIVEVRHDLKRELSMVQKEQMHLKEDVQTVNARLQNQEKVQRNTNENIIKLMAKFNVQPAPKPELKKVEAN